MNRISGIMAIHWRDKWTWFYLPFIILFGSFFINITISFFMDTTLYTGGIMSLYIYLFVIGQVSVHQLFPFALGMGVRRKDFMAGTMLYGTMTSLVYAIMLCLLAIIESEFTNGWGTLLSFFSLPYWSNGNMFVQLLTYFIVLLLMYFLGLFLAIIYKRFQFKGLIIVFLGLVIISSLASYIITGNQGWISIWEWVSSHTALGLAMWTLPITAICCIGSYNLGLRITT